MTTVVGIDASRYQVHERTGTETYSFELINAMVGQIPGDWAVRSYTNRLESPGPPALAKLGEIRDLSFPRFWTHARLSTEMTLHRPDLLFVPSHVIPLIHPASVVTIHDLGYLHEPDTHPKSQRQMLDKTTRWNARASTHIIAISGTTRDDLVTQYGVQPEKVTVVHHGVSARFKAVNSDDQNRVTSRYGLSGPFVLAVGTIQPRKNLARLAAAVRKLRDAGADLRLVLVGRRGWMSESVLAEVRGHLPGDIVVEPGYVPLDDLPALYSAAAATALVSTYEGFGLPVIEALACGSPLLISDTPALVEVAGGAAYIVSAHSTDAISRGLSELLAEATGELRQRVGIERARQFSWNRTARETIDVLSHVLDRSRQPD